MEARRYQCPCCGATLVWNGASKEMACASCGNNFPVESLEQVKADEDRMQTAGQDFKWEVPGTDASTEGLKAFRCSSCGGEIVLSDTGAAAQCPYCGNPSVMPQVLTGEFKPNKVLPFVKSEEDAKAAYVNMCKGKKLLPRGYGSQEQQNKIRGIYVPFWLYDCVTDADITYKATRVTHHRQGNYEIVRTAHYHVARGGAMAFDDVPVNSSTKLDDTLMEAVEPFDYSKAEPFSMAYLSGYEAERYNQAVDQCAPRARQRVENSVRQACDASVIGYTTFAPTSVRIDVKRSRAENVMMPVYLLNNQHDGKTYTFAMNGQTGQIKGDLPVDKGRAVIMWLIWFLIGTGIALAVLYYAMTTGVFG